MGVSVYGCVRARVWCMITCQLDPELNQSVSNQNQQKVQLPGQDTYRRSCTGLVQNLPRSWAPGQDLVLPARSWPHGQDLGLMGKILNILPKCLGQELFAG